MEWFSIILLIICIILFLFIIAIIIFTNSGSGLNQKCSSESDCHSGLVCSWMDDHVCKAGINSTCKSTNDCIGGLMCNDGKCKFISKTNNMIKSIPNSLRPRVIQKITAGNTNNANDVKGNTGIIGSTGNSNKSVNFIESNTPNQIPPVNQDPIVDQPIKLPINQPIKLPINQPINQPIPNVQVNVDRKININQSMFNVNSQSETNRTSANTGCSDHIEIGSESTELSNATSFTPFAPIDNSPNKGYISRSCDNATDRNVIDVCSYSDSVVSLLANGNIIKEVKSCDSKGIEKISIKNNIKIGSLSAFDGRLYGVSNGTLFALDNSTYTLKKWLWYQCSWAPIGIIYMNATLMGDHLWLQTDTDGMLYNKGLQIEERITLDKLNENGIHNRNVKRVYGLDKKTYINIRTSTCDGTLFPSMKYIDNICDAVIDNYGELTVVKRDQLKDISGVRMVNWVPYYLRN